MPYMYGDRNYCAQILNSERYTNLYMIDVCNECGSAVCGATLIYVWFVVVTSITYLRDIGQEFVEEVEMGNRAEDDRLRIAEMLKLAYVLRLGAVLLNSLAFSIAAWPKNVNIITEKPSKDKNTLCLTRFFL